jgi:hypothetical protein
MQPQFDTVLQNQEEIISIIGIISIYWYHPWETQLFSIYKKFNKQQKFYMVILTA